MGLICISMIWIRARRSCNASSPATIPSNFDEDDASDGGVDGDESEDDFGDDGDCW